MKKVLLSILMLSSTLAFANTSIPYNAVVHVDFNPNTMCLYAGKVYSVGSVISIPSGYQVCKDEKSTDGTKVKPYWG